MTGIKVYQYYFTYRFLSNVRPEWQGVAHGDEIRVGSFAILTLCLSLLYLMLATQGVVVLPGDY